MMVNNDLNIKKVFSFLLIPLPFCFLNFNTTPQRTSKIKTQPTTATSETTIVINLLVRW